MRVKRGVLEQEAGSWLEVAELLLRSRQGTRLAKQAIYCAGYAIEFLLKALICRYQGVEELPSDYETHDLHRLAKCAGVLKEMEKDPAVKRLWHDLTGIWSPELRYTGQRFSKRDAEKFLGQVQVVFQWLKERKKP
jgi:HEPN domain-containing protein